MVLWTTIDVDNIKSKADYDEKIGLLATAAEEIAVSVATHEEVSHGAGEITESEDDDDHDEEEGQKLERKAARFEHKKEKLKARADKGKVEKLQKKMEKYQKKGACSAPDCALSAAHFEGNALRPQLIRRRRKGNLTPTSSTKPLKWSTSSAS